MRRFGLMALAIVVLAGCQREKSFDERYADAEARMSAMARSIDAEVAASEAALEDRAPGAVTATAAAP